MSLFIVNLLPPGGAETKRIIDTLTGGVDDFLVVNVDDKKILPCLGCNNCWLKTPGRCMIKDDNEELLRGYLHYDTTIFVCDTAMGFVSYRVKNIFDRVLPLFQMFTFLDKKSGQMRHVPRYKKSFRFGLIYSESANGEYIKRWFDRFCVNMLGQNLGAYSTADYEGVMKCIL